jgi:hypothetical protein
MNGVDNEAIVSVSQRPFTNPAMSSWAPRSRLRLRMLTVPLRADSVRIGRKSVIAMASRPATFGSRRLRSYLPFARIAHENSGEVSTAVRRRRRGGLHRPVCAGRFSPAEQRCVLSSESALQTGVRSGIPTNSSSSRSSSSGRLHFPVSFPANFLFRIRPLPKWTNAV